MAAELAVLVTEPNQKAALQSIATMLYNTITNFSLFAPRIADSLATQRGALDKSIKDFVKLASWKIQVVEGRP
jgi:midasin (ATPase involved in ribosome maturation)